MLDKPIVVFDLETTGKDLEKDRVIQIAMLKYLSLESTEPAETYTTYVNPDGREIHPEAQAVHGISDEMVLQYPLFRDIAHDVKAFIGDSALSGYNIRAFDIPVLQNEFSYAEMGINWILNRPIIDTRTLWLRKEPRDLKGAVKKFCGEDFNENAHNALADTVAVAKVLQAQLKLYDLTGKTWEDVEREEDPAGEHKGVIGSKSRIKRVGDDLVFLFGKYKDKSVIETAQNHPDYIEWILKGNFEKVLKDILRKLMHQLHSSWQDPTVTI